MNAVVADAARTDTVRRLEDGVGALIGRVRHAMAERAREVHEDLAPSAYLAASYIDEHGPVRASDLCAVLTVDKGAISRQVQHLVELELVSTSPDPEDGRATLLSISELGRRRLRAVSGVRSRLLDERLATWSDDDLTTFVDLLERYNATVSRQDHSQSG